MRLQQSVLIRPLTAGPSNPICMSQARFAATALCGVTDDDLNKLGGLTLHGPEALADYIAAVSKSAQADVDGMRLFPANSNS